jgi:hypothetical protein
MEQLGYEFDDPVLGNHAIGPGQIMLHSVRDYFDNTTGIAMLAASSEDSLLQCLPESFPFIQAIFIKFPGNKTRASDERTTGATH